MPDVPPADRDRPARDLSAFPAAGTRAIREMAGMFDHVSRRYDLLNSLMTLGQDRAWRAAMWRAIPEHAHAVLDLCTGSGVSLEGLLRSPLIVGVPSGRLTIQAVSLDAEAAGLL